MVILLRCRVVCSHIYHIRGKRNNRCNGYDEKWKQEDSLSKRVTAGSYGHPSGHLAAIFHLQLGNCLLYTWRPRLEVDLLSPFCNSSYQPLPLSEHYLKNISVVCVLFFLISIFTSTLFERHWIGRKSREKLCEKCCNLLCCQQAYHLHNPDDDADNIILHFTRPSLGWFFSIHPSDWLPKQLFSSYSVEGTCLYGIHI